MPDYIIESITNGGYIMLPIFLCSVFTWYIFIDISIKLKSEKKRVNKNPTESESINREVYKLYFFSPLYRKLKLIKLFSSITPLMGLTGTVLGMINTFSVLGIYGNTNPAILTDGIAVALTTTKAGLLAAFPAMFIFSFLKKKLYSFEEEIERIKE